MTAIFAKIMAWIMVVLSFIFPWINSSKPVDVASYIVEDKTISVYLPSNPTTGYTWEYDVYGNGVKFQSENYTQSIQDSEICGAGGTTVFKFVADSEGDFEIVLTYLRAWEDSIPASTVTIKGTTDSNGNITISEFNH